MMMYLNKTTPDFGSTMAGVEGGITASKSLGATKGSLKKNE